VALCPCQTATGKIRKLFIREETVGDENTCLMAAMYTDTDDTALTTLVFSGGFKGRTHARP